MNAARALLRRLNRARPPLVDVAFAAGYTTVAILIGRERHEQWRAFDETAYVLTVLANMPVAFRRRAPVAITVFCATVWVWYITAGYWPALNVYGSYVALYTVTAMRPRWMTVVLGIAGAGIWLYAGLLAKEASIPSVAAQAVVFTGVLWKFGDNARKLEQRNQELAEATRRLREEQAERARQAVVAERLRIAVELHDIVAHHMSVISVQAGLAEYVFPTDPGTARDAVGVIGTTSREAQEELRRMLGLLRRRDAPDGEHGPAPGLDQLDELAGRMRAAGVPTEVVISGSRRPLPPGRDLCAYRVIQESLTNVLKHAGPASATVVLDFQPGRFTARVTDDGRGTAPTGGTEPAVGSGHGLMGMKERARLYGGTLTAGPRRDGGYAVTLMLPIVD